MTYRRLTVAETSGLTPVSRRDFLKLRVSEGKRVLELSCESLYMRYQDARSGAARRQVSNHDDPTGPGSASMGLVTPTPDELFAELDRQLAEADELRVLERDWLDRGVFGHEVGERLEAFRRHGGRVELGDGSTPPSVAKGAPEA